MNKPVSHYTITEKTMALIPAAHMDYQTIVMETDQILYVQQRPFEIIENACLNDFCSYEGKRKSMMHHTDCKNKVPIPISPSRQIYAFPTNSPSLFECHRIFYLHVDFFSSNPDFPHTGKPSIIHFKNGQKLPMSESVNVLKQQRQRTAVCMLTVSQSESPSKLSAVSISDLISSILAEKLSKQETLQVKHETANELVLP